MKKIVCLGLCLVMLLFCAACAQPSAPAPEQPEQHAEPAPKEKEPVNVFVLTGPTGIGAVRMWSDADAGKGKEEYHFSAVAAPDEIVSKLSSGDADIAAISTNLAAKLYQKTSGGIRVLAVNTLGVLHVLAHNGEEIGSLADLKGKTVVTTGQGANPEYIIRYLIEKNGLDPDADLSLSFKAEGGELVNVWATQPDAILIAPQPVATTICMKNEGAKSVLDLSEEWQKVSPESALMMGCIVVRNEFFDAHPEAVADFLTDYQASVAAANEDPEGTGELCESYGIVPNAKIAAKAIPACNLCYIDGTEMQSGLSGYLTVLFDADPSSIGGKLPDDGFYYLP